MKFNKIITITVLSLIICKASISQEKMNATKIRYSPFLAGNIDPAFKYFRGMLAFSQERAINERMSVQVSLRLLPGRVIEDLNDDVNTTTYKNEDYNPFINPKFSALGNYTELRIYSKKKEALQGFYWGPYLHYTTYKIQSERDYYEDYDNNGVLYYGEAQARYKLNNFGLGIQIGIQKIFNNGITLDWTIFGIGFNGVKGYQEVDVINSSGNFDFREYEDDVRNSDTYTSFGSTDQLEMQFEKESVTISTKRHFNSSSLFSGSLDVPSIPFFNIKTGLSIGFGY